MQRTRPVLAPLIIPASRYIGSISEEYMSASHNLRSEFLEFLLQQHGVNARLVYSMQTPTIEPGRPAHFRLSVIADTRAEIDQFYPTIEQVLKPFLL